ncbi:uncharacterized protein STEHIDRAFT_163537 [Stereum hirsutum FP-91666 SS1]|uniref:Nephrocystin 3-like N-terminal domain-containing protein n=1 Tax=Stereum hirsutum (strain FP-91666) TaxID=721885 RepID=R7RWM9_STEHR|nr:uncharacterized protein STEHIDRAFT_163537 [Stereum hirsutum FP-91666 SS1]EIM79719.1 hypothetical protein STEHIDRAFT_163537 [Stereum hirsutum FP-91666 SS1]
MSDSRIEDDSESAPTSCIHQIYSWFKIALKFGGIATEAFPVAKAPVLALIEILKIVDETAENKEKHADINQRLLRLEIQFNKPIPGDDRCEEERRGQVQRQANNTVPIHSSNLTSNNNARLEDCVNQIRVAIADYQLGLQQQDHVYLKVNTTIPYPQANFVTEQIFLCQELADAQRLDKLPYSSLAMFEKAIESRTKCFGDTRAEVLGKLKLWISDPEDHRIFWLNGMAGTGKTTISISLADYTRDKGLFRAGFFCSRDFDETRDIKRIFPSIAYQLPKSNVSSSDAV